MIKSSTRLPFCPCFHPAWIAGKQQGSCDWLKLGRWYAAIGYTPIDLHCSIWKKLQNWHTVYTMLHISFKLEALLIVIYYPNGFLEKKNYVNIAVVQILADVIQKAQAICSVSDNLLQRENPKKYIRFWPIQYFGPSQSPKLFVRSPSPVNLLVLSINSECGCRLTTAHLGITNTLTPLVKF